MDNSDAKILITDSHLTPFFGPILHQFTKLTALLFTGDEDKFFKSIPYTPNYPVESLPKVCSTAQPWTLPSPSISIDLAALIYTSGSTGDPKGVMQTNQSMIFAAQSIAQYLRLSSDHHILNVLPLAFDYGLYQVLMSILIGATIILERSFTYHTNF